MRVLALKGAIENIAQIMEENKDYLVELDSKNGDGDLGISMAKGYRAIADYLATAEETDLGKTLMRCSAIFNEKSPSTLGTITSVGLLGMAKVLKGSEDANLQLVCKAFDNAIKTIMEKAKSKPGEKTILDALYPAVEALKNSSELSFKQAFENAALAAGEGSENTKNMLSVHGRAAYYGEKSLGVLDGGSVVGKLIFKGISDFIVG